jgi:hypothetical protein
MKFIPSVVFAFVCLAAVAAEPPGLSSSAADAAWERVKSLGKPSDLALPATASPAAVAHARNQAAAQLVADADNLKAFYSKYPDHLQAHEAKRLEALSLIFAWRLGDSTQETRRRQLVSEVRRDPALPAAKRGEVAAYADNVEVLMRASLSPTGRLAAFESVVRALVAEFPTVPDGYESLVQIAKASSDDKTQSIAREVIAMPSAPASAKAEAKALLDRYALVGKSVAELAKPILGSNNAVDRAAGHPLVIYSWGTFSPASIVLGKKVLAQIPSDAAVLGVCLDQRDVAPAKARAGLEKLPGDQVFDWLGRKGELAERLSLTEPGLVYVVDGKGLVRSVSAQHDLPAAFAALTSP